jgi:hypothetical protein
MPHTPGPWSASIGVHGASINIANVYSHPLSFGVSWELNPGDPLREEAQANMALIAAAPELHAALTEAFNLIGAIGGPSYDEAYRARVAEKIAAALKKATEVDC